MVKNDETNGFDPGGFMKAAKNISEITLAVEGARGPPELKKRTCFPPIQSIPFFHEN